MQTRRLLIVAGLAACVLPVMPVRAGTDPAAVCRPDSLPSDIQDSLRRNFTGWRIEAPTDLTPDMLARWTADTPGTCPGLISGHFQSRNQTDYVVLLMSPASPGYRLVAFREAAPGLYGFKMLDQGAGGASGRYLRPASPARRYVRQLPSSGDGALLLSSGEQGNAATLYFWDKTDWDARSLP